MQLCLRSIILWLASGLVHGGPVVLAEFPMQFREGLLWVEIDVPHSDQPLNFLLDSGASVSSIDLRTARRLGLKLGRRVAVQGVHKKLSGYWPLALQARASGVDLPAEFLALDLSRLSRSCPRPVHGLIGADFFRGRVVQIDFEYQRVRVLAAGTELAGESIPLEVRSCGMRIPVVIDGRAPQRLRLDTGCASALQWVTSEFDPDSCGRKLAVGLSDLSIPQTSTTVDLGVHQFRQVPTGLHRQPIFPGEAGLLGNPLLSRFGVVTIDAKSSRLFLGRTTPHLPSPPRP